MFGGGSKSFPFSACQLAASAGRLLPMLTSTLAAGEADVPGDRHAHAAVNPGLKLVNSGLN